MRNTDRLDRNYRRCNICGMPVRIDREQFTGYMNTSVHESTLTTNPYDIHNAFIDLSDDFWLGRSSTNAVRIIYYTKVNSGCWFCGNSIKANLRNI